MISVRIRARWARPRRHGRRAATGLGAVVLSALLPLATLPRAAAQPGQRPTPSAPGGAPTTPPVVRPRVGSPPRPPSAPAVPAPAPPAGGSPAAHSPAPGPLAEVDTEAPPAFKAIPPGAKVTFNLENANLRDLVRLIATITGRRFILPSKIRDIQATVFAPTQVTAAEAYRAFLSVLEINGLTVVPAGRYLKVVETGGIANQPLPTFDDNAGTPRDDRYLTRLHRAENVAAEDVAKLLEKFKSKDGSITTYAPTNMVILTDTGANIRRMLRILQAVDVQRTGEQIWVEPIHYADATELAKTIEEIYPSAQSGGGSKTGTPATPPRPAKPAPRPGMTGSTGGTVATVGKSRGSGVRLHKILADERTNALVIIATEPAYLRVLELIRHFDVPLEGEGRVRVHFLQHGDAEEIATTLQSIVGGGSGARRPPRPGGANQAAAGQAATAGLFEGEVRITAHAASNALVITSSLHDYAAIKKVIEELDAPRRQVFIEAVIMELEVRRGREFGVSYHGGVPDFPADGSLSILGFDAQNSISVSPDLLTGLAVGVRGPTIAESQQLVGLSVPAFGVALNAIANSGESNVLSTPHIIALDNTEAEINVGENIPLQTSGFPAGGLAGLGGLLGGAAAAGQQQNPAGGLGALAGAAGGFAGAIPRQDVGTILRITPHINDDDGIRLEIEQEVSSRGTPEGTLGVVPINRRQARTEVAVRDQQTVVIGGLMTDRVGKQQTKVPILGDIPVLGVLFRNTTKTTEKRNLILILTPHIMRDPADLRALFERKMRERQEFIDRFFVFGEHDYTPPLDYSRTRGLVAEISNEIAQLKREAELAAAAEGGPNAAHRPRPPLGSAPTSQRGGSATATQAATGTLTSATSTSTASSRAVPAGAAAARTGSAGPGSGEIITPAVPAGEALQPAPPATEAP
ncbi:MAG: type II secretion system secretin GspD [Polyangiales bacterium]